ncbi:hypothetical protein AMS68_006953 [Peltaster fructicola]|uniref:PH domain-containing protein n=1 Tax=Peltaster fructicola TaxID=286661 RepID=A0A6H0Y3A9_9PEZI|nr:hypothetical protein AMS68_006953 [Peltaster fructicola]
MSATTSPTTNLPTRSSTMDPDDAIPDEDSSETTKLFHERLQAWKHACGYLEDYVQATEKMQHQHGKEYEKVLKTVNSPLKEGHHFDQNLGGIAGLFENIRSNTQGVSNAHFETAKTLKGSVLPIFERLHSEIKNKTKELTKGAGKGAKLVDKARNTSQKHIELLGQHTAAFDSSAGSVKAADDPYVLQRQVYHRLNKQVIEENNNRDDLISVQNSFSQFEAHIIQTIQTGLAQFNSVIQTQTESTRNMYGDIAATSHRIPPNFEWDGFIKRNSNTLIDPSVPKRSVENIGFANQDHKSTQPLIAGSLERKGKVMKSYSTSYYVITPSKYLHEFKTDDDFAKDPTPENSLYLPDCMIGAVDGVKFNVRGKDASKGVLAKMSLTHEYSFRAHTPQDAMKWHDVIASVAGQSSNETLESAPGSPSGPVGQSPVAGSTQSPIANNTQSPVATTGQTTGQTVPTTAATHTEPVGQAHTGSATSDFAHTSVPEKTL